jgi:hypothetical protein
MLAAFHVSPPPLPSNAVESHYIINVVHNLDSLAQVSFYSSTITKSTETIPEKHLLVHFLSFRSALFLCTLLLGVDLGGKNGSWIGLVVTELYFVSLRLSFVVHRMITGCGLGLRGSVLANVLCDRAGGVVISLVRSGRHNE